MLMLMSKKGLDSNQILFMLIFSLSVVNSAFRSSDVVSMHTTIYNGCYKCASLMASSALLCLCLKFSSLYVFGPVSHRFILYTSP